jgi:hypothetical protein
MQSFKKSLGIRPKRVLKKIPRRVTDDGMTFFTFNTVRKNDCAGFESH